MPHVYSTSLSVRPAILPIVEKGAFKLHKLQFVSFAVVRRPERDIVTMQVTGHLLTLVLMDLTQRASLMP